MGNNYHKNSVSVNLSKWWAEYSGMDGGGGGLQCQECSSSWLW